MNALRVITAFVFVLSASIANGASITISDPFDGPSLGPEWTVSFDPPGRPPNAASWTYGFDAGALAVTDVEPLGLAGEWSYASLQRPLRAATDLAFRAEIGWDSSSSLDLMNLFLILYGEGGQRLALVAYHDAWSAFSGEHAVVADASDNRWASGYGSLPLVGRSVFEIERVDGMFSLRIDGVERLAYDLDTPATTLGLEFGYYDDSLGSTIGTLYVHDLAGAYTPTPEPGAWLLIAVGLALAGLAPSRWRR